jgi:hypothetical protein
MKTILTILGLCLLSISAFAQGTSIRSLNGLGTNTTLYTTTSGGKRVVVAASQALLDDAERFSILWGSRAWVDSSGLVGSGNYGDRYLTNAAGGEYLNWNLGNITNQVRNALDFKTNTIFMITISGSGGVIATGPKEGFPVAGDNYTISGWSITAMGTSPTATIDIWKIAAGTALPTVANTIMGTKPALAVGNVVNSTVTTGWNTTVTKGDIWGLNVDACSNATNMVVQIFGFRK